jgi:hypothetical protein
MAWCSTCGNFFNDFCQVLFVSGRITAMLPNHLACAVEYEGKRHVYDA